MHYKFIDLPGLELIQERIWKNIPQSIKDDNTFISCPVDEFKRCTPLIQAVETIKPWVEVCQIGIVVVAPNNQIPVHTDLGEHNVVNKYALNIPIHNCDIPHTSFYQILPGAESRVVDAPHGKDYLTLYSKEHLKEIGRMWLYKPAFFNTQVPHGIINPTNEPRIAISIRWETVIDLSSVS